MAQRIFLSYRRSDTANQATALKIVLEKKLPSATVFVDTASISPGQAWPGRLVAALEDSAAIIALIGPSWRFGPDGIDRFQDSSDWVLQEVAHGLRHKPGAFIPVTFGHPPASNYEDLPEPLAELSTIQARELTAGARWAQDVDGIASDLAKVLGTTKVGGAVKYPSPSELKARAPKLSEGEFEELKRELDALDGWVFTSLPIATAEGEVQGTEISRSFAFENFKRAFNFMGRVAELAEGRPHHPDWTNVWSRVDVRLRTFDADQSVTWYDIDMACEMHRIAADVSSQQDVGWPLRPPD